MDVGDQRTKSVPLQPVEHRAGRFSCQPMPLKVRCEADEAYRGEEWWVETDLLRTFPRWCAPEPLHRRCPRDS